MKHLVENILAGALGAVAIAAIVLGLVGDRGGRRLVRCRGIDVEVKDSCVNRFVNSLKVRQTIDREYGGYLNIPVSELNLTRMEDVLKRQAFTREAQCWVTRDGILHATLSQITPVARFASEDGLIYIAEDGRCIRTDEDWKEGILKLSGELRDGDRQWMRSLGEAATAISADAGLKSGADTLFCRSNGECDLKIKGLKENFLLGMPGGIAGELVKIREYRTKIRGEYQCIDLRFKGMIICKK